MGRPSEVMMGRIGGGVLFIIFFPISFSESVFASLGDPAGCDTKGRRPIFSFSKSADCSGKKPFSMTEGAWSTNCMYISLPVCIDWRRGEHGVRGSVP